VEVMVRWERRVGMSGHLVRRRHLVAGRITYTGSAIAIAHKNGKSGCWRFVKFGAKSQKDHFLARFFGEYFRLSTTTTVPISKNF